VHPLPGFYIGQDFITPSKGREVVQAADSINKEARKLQVLGVGKHKYEDSSDRAEALFSDDELAGR
jgi:hypothetical protein